MDNYQFDNHLDWNIKACNTAYSVIKNEKLLRYYTDKSIEYMRHTCEQNDGLAYIVLAEQRMLPMCAKKLDMSIMSYSDLNRLFTKRRLYVYAYLGYETVNARQCFLNEPIFADDLLNDLLKIIPK
jgi:hypothetical protein